MSTLLAHHLEAHHMPVLLAFLAGGFFIGWELFGKWLGRGRARLPEPPGGDKAPGG